jgi:hypothetical protein
MPFRSFTRTPPLTKTQVQRRAHARVALYLRLYESEGWPPEGPHGTDPIDALACHHLAYLASIMKALWKALPDTAPLTRRVLMRRTTATGTLRERHLALRLGRCCGLMRGERNTNSIWRVPPSDAAPSISIRSQAAHQPHDH